MKKVKVLGIKIFAGNLEYLVRVLTSETQKTYEKTKLVSATSAHGLIHSTMNARFKEMLSQFDINAPDGMPITWVAKLKGYKQISRCYGPDLFKKFIEESANTQITHFLCGGQEGVAMKLKATCNEQFNNNNVVGVYSPPFRAVEDFDYLDIAEKINASKADIVWIGLSTPKQEEFAFRLARHTSTKFIITVGAAFDFHIGALRQAPSWVQKVGMEWFFRFLMEPRRLAKRYIQVVPLFICYNLFELISSKLVGTKD